MRALLLTLHILGACVWTGGHLVLATTVLPRALALRDSRILRAFEEPFERIGIPALIVQVLTGVWLASQFAPISRWLAFGNALETRIGVKLILLGVTVALALHARLRLIPRLDGSNLRMLAAHIVVVTALAVALVVVGASFQTGSLF
ncbi:MAG TPA: CopD family protein [Methylomirabilota bacterium]|nr:CopD family protein [Methylomirabilota bacterium]